MSGICANAVVNLLGISVRAIRNIVDIMRDMNVNEKDKGRLAIILSLTMKSFKDITYYEKIVKSIRNLDEDFTINVLFPYIIFSLKDTSQEILVDYMEVASEKFNENKYLGVCKMSRELIDELKKIETCVSLYGDDGVLEKVRPAELCDRK
jgi:predicted transport protein